MASARARETAVVLGSAMLAGGLCLIHMRGRSLGFDEAATVAIASQHGSALWSAIAHDGGNMTGYYLLLHLTIAAFGHGELALRLPSAAGATAASGLTGLLALRLFDRRVALAAGALMGVSLPLVFWGQSARSYAILVALSAASFLAFSAMLDSRRPRASWMGYVLCTALALYASLMASLLVAAQLAAAIWRPRERGRVATAVAAIAVCCVPLIILAIRRGTGQLFWVARPDLTGVKQVAEALTSAGLQPTIRSTSTTYALLALTLLLLLAAAGAIVARGRRWPALLVLSWLVVPVVIALVESFVGSAIFVPRNLLIVLPAVALMLAWGLTRVTAGWLVLSAVIALRALQLAPAYGVSPEDWRGATAYVMARTERGDCVAFYPSDGRNAFRYYAHRDQPRSVLPAVPWAYDRAYIENYATLVKLPAGCARLWLLSSHVGQANGPARSRANLSRYRSLRAMLSAAYGKGRTREFGYADPVTVELFGPRSG
jgi:mannosyltransferase